VPIKAVTFDLDDTLWAIAPVIERAERLVHEWFERRYPRLALRYGVDAMRALRTDVARRNPDAAHDLGFLRRETFRIAALECGYDASAADGAYALFMTARHDLTPFDDVLPVLDGLRRRYRLGALSNGNADLRRLGLGAYFHFALSAHGVGRAKPHRAMFERACAAAGARPEEIVHVGDHPEHDVQGAARAGLRTVWVNRDARPWERGRRPDAEITGLHDLEAVLQRFGAGSGADRRVPGS
jgi:putative hydrolase of the HAD superfamily